MAGSPEQSTPLEVNTKEPRFVLGRLIIANTLKNGCILENRHVERVFEQVGLLHSETYFALWHRLTFSDPKERVASMEFDETKKHQLYFSTRHYVDNDFLSAKQQIERLYRREESTAYMDAAVQKVMQSHGYRTFSASTFEALQTSVTQALDEMPPVRDETLTDFIAANPDIKPDALRQHYPAVKDETVEVIKSRVRSRRDNSNAEPKAVVTSKTPPAVKKQSSAPSSPESKKDRAVLSGIDLSQFLLLLRLPNLQRDYLEPIFGRQVKIILPDNVAQSMSVMGNIITNDPSFSSKFGYKEKDRQTNYEAYRRRLVEEVRKTLEARQTNQLFYIPKYQEDAQAVADWLQGLFDQRKK